MAASSDLAMAKPRSKRKQDGELVTASWESFRANQEALEAHLGPDGAQLARERAQRLVSGGWAAAWPAIE